MEYQMCQDIFPRRKDAASVTYDMLQPVIRFLDTSQLCKGLLVTLWLSLDKAEQSGFVSLFMPLNISFSIQIAYFYLAPIHHFFLSAMSKDILFYAFH